MNRTLRNLLLVSPAILGMSVLSSSQALAADVAFPPEAFDRISANDAESSVESQPSTIQLSNISPSNFATSPTFQIAQAQILPIDPLEAPVADSYANPEAQSMDQVTSVSQLSDVSPTDWAFQALQSLVERYGCIAGYPDGTYRGNRSLTRYEFAAGVNACLDQINRLIAGAVADAVTREDLEVLNKLQEEFAAEIAVLRGRMDSLEARTSEIEANQFSTTTKLEGEVLFIGGDTFGEFFNSLTDDDDDDDDDDDNLDDLTDGFFSYRTRLLFATSFSGADRLRIRLQSANTPNLGSVTGTNMARLNYDDDTDNDLVLNQAWYTFPSGKAKFYIGAVGLASDDILPTLNPYFDSSGGGSVSRFGSRNPIYRGPQGAGAGLSYAFSKNFSLQLAYLVDDVEAPDPSKDNGFFGGSYSALGQLTLTSKKFDFGVTYAYRSFTEDRVNVTGSTGSGFASKPFGDVETKSNNVGVQANWKIGPKFALGGWFGYTWADQDEGGDNSATIMNGAVTLSFPDLGKAGNLGGIMVGVPPKVTDNDMESREDDDDATSLHIEAFYRYQFNDFISITPGFYVITNPNHNEDNDTVWVGTLRTQFRF